ncbi:MAG: DEAD/DEAH box helicase [Clostridiales bacterium]|jgi:superfamily II DNA or RNA helicase|nr:DEAD/DEAH box helicase [Clostridiales bacterium]
MEITAIRSMATNESVFAKGRVLVDCGAVDKPTVLDEGGSSVYLTSVTSGGRTYSVSIEVSKDSETVRHDCDCYSHKLWRGACEHVVAALLAINPRRTSARARDERAARYMIERFERRAIEEMDDEIAETSALDKIRLVPTLGLDDERYPYLTLTVGRDKQYVVKDICAFADAVRTGETVSYGKSLTFAHRLSAFDERSRLIASLARGFADEKPMWMSKAPNLFYYGARSRRGLYLNPGAADEFLSAMDGGSLLVRAGDDGERRSHPVTRETPPIAAAARQTPDGGFVIDCPYEGELRAFAGKRLAAVIYGGTVYVQPTQYLETLRPLAEAFSQGKGVIPIPLADSNRFANIVYPRLLASSLIKECPELDAIARQAKLSVKLYFDSDGGAATCRAEFHYDGTAYNPLAAGGAKTRSPWRDALGERRVIKSLETLGFAPDAKRGRYVLESDDKVYDLIYEPSGLAALMEQYETFVSDSFQVRSKKPKVTASVGVRLAGGLLEVSVGAEGYSPEELLDIINSYNLRKRYHKLRNGAFVDLAESGAAIAEAGRLIDGLDLTKRDLKKGTIRVPRYRALYLRQALETNKSLSLSMDDGAKQLADEVAGFGKLDFVEPPELRDILREYQKEGFKWLSVISRYGFGGILADDMGLGKTIQVISLLLAEKGRTGRPSIVVAPTSLVYNWESEIKRFAPSLAALPVVGTASRRRQAIGADACDVYITTYDSLKKDIDSYKEIEFEYVVADEAQYIKNPGTLNAKAIKSLKSRARYALTGTPIENSLSELWSIFDFIMPGYLFASHARFGKQYETPIMKDADEGRRDALKRQIAPFILRRLKSDVLRELPEKIETTLYADMTEEQRKLYTAHLLLAKGALDESIREGTLPKRRIDVLAQITRLRQICCHPGAFIEDYGGGSGKLEAAMETIADALSGGHRVLLFSQFTSVLGIIRERMDKEGISYFYLDGHTPSLERTGQAAAFNGGERDCFLVSLKAGGTGLNITGADVVILFDPWWNPAVMEQASGRAHRIGQTRSVLVYSVIAKNSVEERIAELQEKKKALVDDVITEGTNFLSAMTQDELVELFRE